MAASLTVLLTTHDPGAGLADLVAGWDSQTAASTTADLVVVDAGSRDGSAERLHQLARRRSNVTVLDGRDDVPGTLLRALREATGTYAVLLRQDQRLTPRAVELLVARADGTGAEVVLGRAASPAGSGSFVLPDDRLLDAEAAAAALPHSLVVLRREPLLDLDDPLGALEDPRPRLVDVPVAGLGSAVVAVTPGPRPAAASTGVTDVSVAWRAGLLEVSVDVVPPAPPAEGLRAWLVLAAVPGPAEHTVPATVDPAEDAGRAAGAWRFVATLDPSGADGRAPLDDGPWDVQLRCADPAGETTSPLAPAMVGSALVDGRPLTLSRSGPGLRLDAGATRTSPLAAVDPADASVVETSSGSLLTLRYPHLHVVGDAVVPARVRLGDLVLPARLVARDGSGALECYVGGLSGTSVVSVSTGESALRPTGLQLVIDDLGRMTLEPVPAPVPVPKRVKESPASPVPGPPRATTSPARSSRPLAQRVRRHLPAPLEPVARRLARVPVLRRAYRGLLGR